MDKASILELLPLLKSKPEDAQGRTGWVIAKCPFAPFKHKNGVDNTASFGVKISEGLSMYNCFSCNSHGDLHDMLIDLRVLGANAAQGYQLGKALQLIANEVDDSELVIPDYSETGPNVPDPDIEFSEQWLSSFQTFDKYPKAVQYLLGRGIPMETAKKLDLRFDTYRQRICFPIRNWTKKLVGFHGRDITGQHALRYYAYKYNEKFNKLVWLGEEHLNLDLPVVVCESVFDYAKIIQVYENVCCSLSSGLSDLKCRRISNAMDVISFYDWGTGGDTARDKLDKSLKQSAVTHIIPEEEEKDPGAMPIELIREYLLQHIPTSLLTN